MCAKRENKFYFHIIHILHFHDFYTYIMIITLQFTILAFHFASPHSNILYNRSHKSSQRLCSMQFTSLDYKCVFFKKYISIVYLKLAPVRFTLTVCDASFYSWPKERKQWHNILRWAENCGRWVSPRCLQKRWRISAVFCTLY